MNLAHAFSIENQHIQAEMIEAIEFPDLANTYRVSSVPQTTINAGAATVIGAGHPNELSAGIKQALSNN